MAKRIRNSHSHIVKVTKKQPWEKKVKAHALGLGFAPKGKGLFNEAKNNL